MHIRHMVEINYALPETLVKTFHRNVSTSFLLDISENELCVVRNPCRDVPVERLYVFSGDVY